MYQGFCRETRKLQTGVDQRGTMPRLVGDGKHVHTTGQRNNRDSRPVCKAPIQNVPQFLNQEDGDIQMKRIALTGALLLSSLVSFNAVAAELSPEEQAAAAVENRKAVFKLLSVANGTLGGMSRGQPYNAEAAILATQRVEILAGMIPGLYDTNTVGVNHGVATRASDTIWNAKADFDQLAADLAAGAVQAREILNTKGEAGVREAVAAIGPKCGACHDRFRLD